MSKRFADSQGGAVRYGGNEMPDTPDDPPKKATAAQLAKRSIKPLKGRTPSRSTSPSKMSPMPNVFGGGGGGDQNGNNNNGGMFGQSAPQPPSASSFSFGGQPTQPASNPFASQSQIFPSGQFGGGFGASQPAPSPGFSAPTSFNFGASTPASTGGGSFTFGASPAKPQENNGTNGANNAGTNGFSFGAGGQSGGFSSPAKQPSTPAGGAFSNPFGNVFGQSQAQPQAQAISDADVAEIEGAGPRLSQEGKLEDLADIVRSSDPKYKDASLAGLNLKELPIEAQRKMLEFVRNPSKPERAAATSNSAFSFSKPQSTSSSFPSFSLGPSSDKPASPAPTFTAFKGFGSTSGDKSEEANTPISPFGSKPAQLNGTAPGDETPASPASAAPSNMFQFKPVSSASASASSASPASTNVFGASKTAESNAPSSGFSFGASKPADPSAPSSGFSFGASKLSEEVSYPTLNGASSSQDASAPAQPSMAIGSTPTSSSTPANPFANIARNTPPTPTPTAEAAKPAETAKTQSVSASMFAPSSQQSSQSSPMKFGATPAQDSSSTPFKPNNPSTPFKGFAAPSPSTNNPPQPAFKGPPAAATPNPAPKKVTWAPSPQPSPGSSYESSDGSSQASTQVSTQSSAPAWSKMRQLNESFRNHLASVNAEQDWGHIVRHYSDQRSKILNDASLTAIPDPTANTAPKTAAPAPPTPNINKRKSDEPHGISDDKRSKGNTSPQKEWSSPAKPMTKTAELFNDIMNSPASSDQQQTSNPFANIQRSSSSTPAKETPKPGNVSTQSTFQFKAPSSTPAKEAPKPAASGFQFNAPPSAPAQSVSGSAVPSVGSAFKFTPATPSSTPTAAPAFSLPKFGVDTGSSTPVNFLSSFGKQAEAEEKKKQKLRKLEDMDSDEDEAEWERKDAEEQAAKKKKLEATFKANQVKFVPGKGFVNASAEDATPDASAATPVKPPASAGGSVFNKTTSAAPPANIFGHLTGAKQSAQDEESDGDDDDDVHEALKKSSPTKPTPTPGRSMFDRTDSSVKDKATASGTPFKFGGGSTFGASTSPAGDNTWKGQENTPIKFGASTATGSTTPEGSPAKPAGNFGGFSTGGFSATNKPAELPKFNFGGTSTASAKPSDSSRPFSGLFGGEKPVEKETAAATASASAAAAPSSSIFASAAGSPSVGFQFGGPKLAPASNTSSVFASAGTSRASTPGGTTDAENSGNDSSAAEPGEEQNDTQQRDLTALTSSEIAENNILFDNRVSAKQFTKGGSPPWTTKGAGPIRLLKDKSSGKLRLFMRAAPSGRIVLNTHVLPTKGLFTNKGKMAQIMAVAADGKTMETWVLSMGKEEGEAKVKEFVDVLHAEIDKAES